MNYYIAIPVWFVLMLLYTKSYGVTRTEHVLGMRVKRFRPLPALIIIAPIVLWAGYRTKWIGDTSLYWKTFEQLPDTLDAIRPYLAEHPKDPAFTAVSIVIKYLIGNDPRHYLLVIALFQGLCLFLLYRKYSVNYLTSIFIFFAVTDYFSFMQNGIRQFVAVCITTLGFGCLVKKQYLLYALIVLVASRFHQTALIMLPIAIIVQGKAWNWRTIGMMIAVLFAMIFVSGFTQALDNMLEDTQYTNVVTDWQTWKDDGANPLRVAVYCVPALISLYGLRTIRDYNDPVINSAANLSIVAAGVFLVSTVTSGIFIGRLPIYASVYSMGILLPWELDNIFHGNDKKTMKRLMVIGFAGFYYAQMHFFWGVI